MLTTMFVCTLIITAAIEGVSLNDMSTISETTQYIILTNVFIIDMITYIVKQIKY